MMWNWKWNTKQRKYFKLNSFNPLLYFVDLRLKFMKLYYSPLSAGSDNFNIRSME
jgi:hypothetical protein